MKTKSRILLISLAAVIIGALMAGYLLNVAGANQPGSSMNADPQKVTTTANGNSMPTDGLSPRIPFAAFNFVRTLSEAQQQATLVHIKMPQTSRLPAGYHLVGAVPEPIGPLMTDPGSGRSFRPQQVTLYYWNQSITDLNMNIHDFYNQGGIIIEQTYAFGVNSTDVYLSGVKQVPQGSLPPDLTIGWFDGYPGIWHHGYAHVFQFDKDMSYVVKGTSLTKEQALAIIDGWLKQ